MKVNKTIEWKAGNGDSMRAEIIVEKKAVDRVLYADGYNIPAGKETYESLDIVVYHNDKKKDTARQKPFVLTEKSYGKKFYEEMKSRGAFAILCDGIAIREEIYNIIVSAIEELSNEASKDEEFTTVKNEEIKKENDRIEKDKKAEEEYQRLIDSGMCPKCGTWCYGDCQTNK